MHPVRLCGSLFAGVGFGSTAQAPMTTALGLAGDDRFAAGLCLIFKVCGAGGVFGHEDKGTPTMDHGSRLMA